MITTNDEAFYHRAKHLRDQAMSPVQRYWHDEIGFNYRMTNLQAALGLAQLQRIDEFLEDRIKIFELYQSYLADIPRIKLNFTADYARNVYWLVCFEVEGYAEAERNNLMKTLELQGIETRPYFYPVSDMRMYQQNSIPTPVTHKVYQRGINLPSYFGLTSEEIEYICSCLRSHLELRDLTNYWNLD